MNIIKQEALDKIPWGNISTSTIRKVEKEMGLKPEVRRRHRKAPNFAAAVEAHMTPEQIEEMKKHEKEKACFLGH